jgi:hypothetical protein
MPKIVVLLALAISLASCSVADTLFNGFKHVSDVRNDLMAATGMKPEVGFNWHNGHLNKVTVTFPHLYRDKPLTELAQTVRQMVTKEFKQAPDDIVLAFSLGPADMASIPPSHQAEAAAQSPAL